MAELRRRGGITSNEEEGGLEKENFVEKIKTLDFHPKKKKAVKTTQKSGGAVSIVGIIIIVILVILETADYMRWEDRTQLVVDTESRVGTMQVHLNISFFDIPCLAVSVDVVDSGGSQMPETQHSILRTRLDQTGRAIGHLSQQRLGSSAITGPKWKPPIGYCGPCYAVAEFEPKRCCNSCLELKKAYMQYDLELSVAEKSEQCIRENPPTDVQKEGCLVTGSLTIRKTKGNFHIAAGASMTQSHSSHQHHVHRIDKDTIKDFDISHHIHQLSFGPPSSYMNYRDPLTDVLQRVHQLSQVKYIIHIVPTRVFDLFGNMIETYQYAATQHILPVDLSSNHYPLPGAFFHFDFSELRILHEPKGKSFISFLLRLCALSSGVYIVIGLCYQIFSAVALKYFPGKFSRESSSIA